MSGVDSKRFRNQKNRMMKKGSESTNSIGYNGQTVRVRVKASTHYTEVNTDTATSELRKRPYYEIEANHYYQPPPPLNVSNEAKEEMRGIQTARARRSGVEAAQTDYRQFVTIYGSPRRSMKATFTHRNLTALQEIDNALKNARKKKARQTGDPLDNMEMLQKTLPEGPYPNAGDAARGSFTPYFPQAPLTEEGIREGEIRKDKEVIFTGAPNFAGFRGRAPQGTLPERFAERGKEIFLPRRPGGEEAYARHNPKRQRLEENPAQQAVILAGGAPVRRQFEESTAQEAVILTGAPAGRQFEESRTHTTTMLKTARRENEQPSIEHPKYGKFFKTNIKGSHKIHGDVFVVIADSYRASGGARFLIDRDDNLIMGTQNEPMRAQHGGALTLPRDVFTFRAARRENEQPFIEHPKYGKFFKTNVRGSHKIHGDVFIVRAESHRATGGNAQFLADVHGNLIMGAEEPIRAQAGSALTLFRPQNVTLPTRRRKIEQNKQPFIDHEKYGKFFKTDIKGKHKIYGDVFVVIADSYRAAGGHTKFLADRGGNLIIGAEDKLIRAQAGRSLTLFPSQDTNFPTGRNDTGFYAEHGETAALTAPPSTIEANPLPQGREGGAGPSAPANPDSPIRSGDYAQDSSD